MEIKSIDWGAAAKNIGITAEVAYHALEEIRERNDGALTDDSIVDAAKPKDHCLHGWFEWRNAEAAVAYRRLQARELMRSIRVTYVESPDTVHRAYEVHTKSARGAEGRTVYTTTAEVMSDPEARDRLIAEAIRAAMDFRRRFRMLHELQAIVEAIDKVLESVGGAN